MSTKIEMNREVALAILNDTQTPNYWGMVQVLRVMGSWSEGRNPKKAEATELFNALRDMHQSYEEEGINDEIEEEAIAVEVEDIEAARESLETLVTDDTNDLEFANVHEGGDLSGLDLSAIDAQFEEEMAKRKQKREAKSAPKTSRPRLQKPNGQSKCLDRETVWPEEAIGFIKRDSFMGHVIVSLLDGGAKVEDYAGFGCANKQQFRNAIKNISEKGYGIRKKGKVSFAVMPKGMTEPKFN